MIAMNEPVWIDQTLNTVIRWQFAASQLEELAGLLAALGIRRADIGVADWQWYQPDLTAVASYLSLRGITDLAGDGLAAAQQAGLKQVAVACSIVEPHKLGLCLEAVMTRAGRLGLKVALLLADLAELSAPQMAAVAEVVNGYEFTAVICDDSKGTGDPFAIYQQLVALQRAVRCPVELRAGNAYGMATANTLAAVKAGVRQLATAVAGIGGYAPWEEVLLAGRQLNGLTYPMPADLAGRCRQVLHMLGLNLPDNKAVIGPDIFAHESGLHVDGVNKAPEIYEPYAPELVGLKRQLVIGKHSGSAAIRTKFAAWGILLEEAELKHLLGQVRTLAISKKAAITDEELQQLYRSG